MSKVTLPELPSLTNKEISLKYDVKVRLVSSYFLRLRRKIKRELRSNPTKENLLRLSVFHDYHYLTPSEKKVFISAITCWCDDCKRDFDDYFFNE